MFSGQTNVTFARRKMLSKLNMEKIKEETWDNWERKSTSRGEAVAV